MTYVEAASISVVVSAAVAVVGLVARGIQKIRLNDLQHIDMKLDVITKQLDANQTTTDRVEAKLDQHIQYHLEQKR